MKIGKIVLKNLDFVIAGVLFAGSKICLDQYEKGNIKFKTVDQEYAFIMSIGGATAMSGVCTALGLSRVLQTHLENKGLIFDVFKTDKQICLAYEFPKCPSSNIWGYFSKEKALKIADDIIKTANEIV